MEQTQKRHVNNLNTEQLYRKRALDRENQRALRYFLPAHVPVVH